MNTLTVSESAKATSISSPAARLTLVAGAAFLLLLTIVHLAKPDLDPSWRPISEYALGEHGWIMTLAFLSWGASAVGLFVALRAHVQTLGGRIGRAFLLVGAAGPILAAWFPMDPITTPPDALTMSGNLHSLGAMLGDGVPIGAALITWSLARHNRAWSTARWSLVSTAVLAWIGVVVVTAILAVYLPRNGGVLGPAVPIGWPSRFMIVAYLGWIMTAACHAMRPAGATQDDLGKAER